MPQVPYATDATAGLAALSICEALLIALSDLKIVQPDQMAHLLKDAATAHRAADSATGSIHRDVADIIDGIARRNAMSRHCI